MKALITIAALTLSFSAYADHHKDHKPAGKKAEKAMDAKGAMPAPTDATTAETDCNKMKTQAEKDACMKAKKGHM